MVIKERSHCKDLGAQTPSGLEWQPLRYRGFEGRKPSRCRESRRRSDLGCGASGGSASQVYSSGLGRQRLPRSLNISVNRLSNFDFPGGGAARLDLQIGFIVLLFVVNMFADLVYLSLSVFCGLLLRPGRKVIVLLLTFQADSQIMSGDRLGPKI